MRLSRRLSATSLTIALCLPAAPLGTVMAANGAVPDAARLLPEAAKPTPTAKALDSRTAAAQRASRNRDLGKAMAAAAGWTGREWGCLNTLWQRESNWDHKAENESSGAYGIPQNITGGYTQYRRYAREQIEWGIRYIGNRYGTPCKALAHSNAKGWY